MNENVFMQGITVDSLLEKMEEIIDRRVNQKIEQLIKPTAKVQYLTRKEVATELQVSMVTIHKWINKGYLKSYRIGRRIWFKNDEVSNALKERKFKP